jgi:hypothetical protein
MIAGFPLDPDPGRILVTESTSEAKTDPGGIILIPIEAPDGNELAVKVS